MIELRMIERTKLRRPFYRHVYSGEDHPNWEKNDKNLGLQGLHDWIRRVKGLPQVCLLCGITKQEGADIHWSDKLHKRQRKEENFHSLCEQCHKKWDKKHNAK